MNDDEKPIDRPQHPAAVTVPIRYHVSPTFGREHYHDDRPCWCAPTVTADGIAIHREDN